MHNPGWKLRDFYGRILKDARETIKSRDSRCAMNNHVLSHTHSNEQQTAHRGQGERCFVRARDGRVAIATGGCLLLRSAAAGVVELRGHDTRATGGCGQQLKKVRGAGLEMRSENYTVSKREGANVPRGVSVCGWECRATTRDRKILHSHSLGAYSLLVVMRAR